MCIQVADDDATLVAKCVNALRDPTYCTVVAERGTRVVREHFSFESFAKEVYTTVSRIADPARGAVWHASAEADEALTSAR
jgi:hypothetical protein